MDVTNYIFRVKIVGSFACGSQTPSIGFVGDGITSSVDSRFLGSPFGFTVRDMKEHDFKQQLRTDDRLRSFADEQLTQFYGQLRWKTTHSCLLNAVRNCSFFGMPQVSVHMQIT